MSEEIIETSLDVGSVQISTTIVGSLAIKATKNGAPISYDGNDLKLVEKIDGNTSRSGGKAAAGAILGGVLTGGVGFLAGAAIGGRRRHQGCYLISFKDGEYIAFRGSRKGVIKYLDDAESKLKIRSKLTD